MPDYAWRSLTESLTKEALLSRLKGNEHDFVERKSRNQRGEWLQTAVAFANAIPIGWPAILFVGVDDSGNPQCQSDQIESLMKSVSDTLSNAYPPIYRHIVPLDVPGGGSCLAVIIPGSPMRPHFAGQSYIRVGDQIKIASESQFAELVAQRNGKAYAISEWSGKEITLLYRNYQQTHMASGIYVNAPVKGVVTVLGCNSHYVSLLVTETDDKMESYPLNLLELGFDYVKKRLTIYLYRDR